MSRWAVWMADAAGDQWVVETFVEPFSALTCLEQGRSACPHRAHGVYDIGNPEAGDQEDRLLDMVESDEWGAA